MSELNVEKKLSLIKKNLDEILGENKLKQILVERDLKVYWGTATTVKPDIGFLVPLCKISDLLKAGCEITILFADLYAYLDNTTSPWELLRHRTEYYECLIKTFLRSAKAPTDKLKFLRGADYQLGREFLLNISQLSTMISEYQSQQSENQEIEEPDSDPDTEISDFEPPEKFTPSSIATLILPYLQALDQDYLEFDAQFGSSEQKKIFTFAEKYMPEFTFLKRSHLINPTFPELCHESEFHIDLLSSSEVVEKMLLHVSCEPGIIEENGVLAFVKHVLFSVNDSGLKIFRSHENGGDILYTNYNDLESDFFKSNLHPSDLKQTIGRYLNQLLEPIREALSTPEMKKLSELGYPILYSAGNVTPVF